MARIALIPIDNRPVCYQLPKLIIEQAKEHILYLPEMELMGDLTKPAQIEKIIKWLSELKDIDIFIISLDTIAYGGLIPSRKSGENIEVIADRINKLAEILHNTKAKVYAFSSIMRIANNNINEEEKIYWDYWGKKIYEYSYNFHKKGNFQTDIPKEILSDYLNTRRRNFEINKYYVELKRSGLFDTLVFSKDDCSQYGLNVLEAKELKIHAKGLNNIFIKTGADEIPLTLLSRAINTEKRIKIMPIYTHPNSINRISKYEDISVKESVESQIELAGGIIADEQNFDMLLLVNNFQYEQGELVMDVEVPTFNGSLNLTEKPYCIADIVNANGSDNDFVSKLFSQDLKKFYGYAGWNTTGNTLGSVIAGALTYYEAQKPDKNSFNKLQTIRFLDDWIYQANIRGRIRENISNLSPDILKENMYPYEKGIKEKFNIQKEIRYYFPWNRFFEIGILI